MDERTLRLNGVEKGRLEGLVARLSPDDLSKDVGHGWSLAVVLAHLAFWDRLDTSLLRRWLKGEAPLVEPLGWADAVNESMVAEWTALPVGDVRRLVVEAARGIDAVVALVPDEVVSQMRGHGEMWWVRRYLHRREHLGAIEAALADP